MTQRRLVIIANPAAGKGRGADALAAVTRSLRTRGANPQVVETTSAGAALAFVKALEPGEADVVAVLGGDGTLHEVVNGLMQLGADGRPGLGVVPVGTGNDYAKMLRIPLDDPGRAAQDLLDGPLRAVDVARMEGGSKGHEYFCNNVGLGFLAAANAGHERNRHLPGRLSYVAGGLSAFLSGPPDLLTVHAGGTNISGRFFLVHVGLGRYCGGGVCLTPDAVLDDGQFAISVVAERSKLKAALQWGQLSAGLKLDDMTRWTADRVTIQGPTGFLLHADGEVRTVPTGVLVLTVLPGRLSVVHGV